MAGSPIEEHIGRWHHDTFGPDRVPYPVRRIALAAKVCEEAGEVAGACIKMSQDRASLADFQHELADLFVSATVLAQHHGWAIQDLLEWKHAQNVERFAAWIDGKPPTDTAYGVYD